MSWTRKPLYIGSHIWFAPLGATYTLLAPGAISQDGTWPDVTDPKWASTWALGICESLEIDPKPGPSEVILNPNPGQVTAEDVANSYAIPEVKFATLNVDVLAPQLALNAQQLFATATTQFNPNGSSSPGIRGILKVQQYAQDNTLILNFQSWAFLTISGSYKGAPKNLTKPEYVATLLRSVNNSGAI